MARRVSIGRVGVLSFRSMKALLDFWNSDTYQRARRLRTEHEFVIAFEAAEQPWRPQRLHVW